MHFFSRYAYIWKFSPELEKQYLAFTHRTNLIALRLINVLIISGMVIFMVVDLFRAVDYRVVLLNRLIALLVAGFLFFISSYRTLTALFIERLIILSIGNLVGFAFTNALTGDMPAFALSNLLVTAIVFVTTISGLRFRVAFWTNNSIFMGFVFFSQIIVTDSFYIRQYPNLATILLYSAIAGIVVESRRRKSFLQFRDLDQQKKIVDDLSNQKSKIISIISHDVASPLRSLSGLLTIQNSGYLKPEEMTKHLRTMNDQLENVLGLLNSLVRWSKSQIDGFRVEFKPIELNEVVVQNLSLFKIPIENKSLTVEFDNKKQLLVLGDSDMILLIVRNLLSNAVKFARPGSSLRVRLLDEESFVLLCVSNEGEPLSEEARKKLFTYQMSATKGTAGERGTGLGLAMTAYFVKLLRGEIFLDSSTSNVTTFCVRLPVAK